MPSSTSRARQAEELELFERLRSPDVSDEQARSIRDELVEMHLPLVLHIAKRYADRGEPLDDVLQAGNVGLVQAVDRYDPSRGVAFSSFAVPTIVGAIRQHFRDATWSMKVPRRVQELRGRIDTAHDVLAQELQRSPTVAEIAARAELDAQDVLDSLELSRARSMESLQPDPDGASPAIADYTGDEDPQIAGVEDAQTIQRLLATLPERDRHIVTRRFFDGASQSQIAKELGISQMHVSRLLSKSLATLREYIDE